MTPEARALVEIRLALGREPDLVLWRLSQGSGVAPSGLWARFGLTPGASDLIGILGPSGRWVALEVKSAHGTTSDEQEMFLATVRRLGGFAAVVRSAADARAALARARRGGSE